MKSPQADALSSFIQAYAWKFAANSPIKEGDQTVGNRTKVKVVKNKLAPPFKIAEFDIIYGEGISREGDLLDLGTVHGVIEKSGAWFSYKDTRLGQGRENVKKFLKENVDLSGDIEEQVRVKLNLVREDKKTAVTA